MGAYSNLGKPFDLEHLVIAVHRGLTVPVTRRSDVRIDEAQPFTALGGPPPAM